MTDFMGANLRERASRLWAAQYPVLVPVAVSALVLGVVFFTHPVPPGIHDALAYTRAAQLLLSKGYYSYNGGPPDATQTPGYPLFLAAMFALARRGASYVDWARAARPLWTAAQGLMVLGIVGCLAQCGRILGGRRLGIVAGLLAAVYLPYAWASTVALSDLLGALLVTVELLVAIVLTAPGTAPRMRTFALLGIVAGGIALVRPIYVPWALIPLLFVVVQRPIPWRDLGRGLAVCALSFVLVMLPWWVRNAVTLHQVVLLNTNSSVTMLDSLGGRDLSPAEQDLASQADSKGPDGNLAVALVRMRQQFTESPVQFLAERSERILSRSAAPWSPFVDAYWEQYNDYDVDRIDYGWFPTPPPASLVLLHLAESDYHLLLLGAALVGVLYVRRSPRLLLAASLPVYAFVAHFFTLFIDRYFLPAMAGVILLAAAGCVGVFISISRWGARRSRSGP